jgi:hypothetical protein
MNRRYPKSGLFILVVATGLIGCSDSATPKAATEPRLSAPTVVPAANTQGQAVSVKDLDLTLPPPSAEQQILGDFSEHHKLPNLFSEEKKEQNMTVGAKVLNDVNNPDYVDSLDGAEVSVDLKLPYGKIDCPLG